MAGAGGDRRRHRPRPPNRRPADSGGRRGRLHVDPERRRAGRRRGRGEHRRLGRLRRGRLDRPGRRLGDAVRGPHRLRGQRQARQHQRRDGAADAERRVRRRVGLGRRHRAADGRRRGRARSTSTSSRATPQIFDDLKLQPWNSRRRRAVRHPPRPRRQPARVQHRDVRRRRPGLVGRDVRRRHAGRRRDLGVRQPDLHRRRRGVPDGHPARPRHHQPVRARPGPVRRRRGPARRSRSRSSASTGRSTPTSRRRSRAAPCSPARRGRSSSTWPRPTAPRSTRVKPVEGATGWSDTWMLSSQGRPPQLHEAVDGLDHVAVGQRPGGRVVRRGAVQPRRRAA